MIWFLLYLVLGTCILLPIVGYMDARFGMEDCSEPPFVLAILLLMWPAVLGLLAAAYVVETRSAELKGLCVVLAKPFKALYNFGAKFGKKS